MINDQAGQSPTGRALLGWTVPGHIAVTEGEGNHYLRCEHGHVGTSMTVSQFMGTDRFVRGFLQDHAHGEAVEYRSLSEVLPETPEPPQEDGPRSDAPTLWRRLRVAARVIKAFKPENPSPELVAFLRDIRDAVDGDLLEDELSGDLMRFARGQGRLLTALLASQGAEIAEDVTDDHSAERAAHADNWEAQP